MSTLSSLLFCLLMGSKITHCESQREMPDIPSSAQVSQSEFLSLRSTVVHRRLSWDGDSHALIVLQTQNRGVYNALQMGMPKSPRTVYDIQTG